MDFWKLKYHEYLNTEGDVIIEGSDFLRSKILKELDPKAYSISFSDWVENRKQTLRDYLSDSILEIRGNEARLNLLAKAVSYERVVPFVGAGLSMSSGLPSWTSFLWLLQSESHVSADSLDTLLSNGEYEKAAQLLYEDLGSNLFNKHLQECFDKQNDIEGAINFLPFLFPKQNIITTNFDKILEKIFLTNQGFDQILMGDKLEEAFRLMAQGGRFLCKIHGTCDALTNRVLIEKEYIQLYEQTGLLRRFLERLITNNTLLFLGCSLTSDRTIKIIEDITNENGGMPLPQHYAFLELSDGIDKIERQKVLAKANIFPIWYPEGEHNESIEALLLALIEMNEINLG